MKAEKEILWIITLLQSDYTKGWIKSKAGTKKDFERTLNAPTDSKEFHQWFNELLHEGCIEDISNNEDIKKQNQYCKYICNTKKLEERLKSFQHYKTLHNYFNKDRVI